LVDLTVQESLQTAHPTCGPKSDISKCEDNYLKLVKRVPYRILELFVKIEGKNDSQEHAIETCICYKLTEELE
jgi:hypothetical protein